MKKVYLALAVAVAMVMGCGEKNVVVEEDLQAAVDLSDVLKVYEQNGRSWNVYEDEGVAKFFSSYEEEDSMVVNEASMAHGFTMELSKYRESEHPFLRQAEDIYNSCMIANGLWDVLEMWIRFSEGSEKAMADSIRCVDVSCLLDKDLRQAALTYRDGMADFMADTEEYDWEEETTWGLRQAFVEVINDKWYKFYEKEDTLDTLQAEWDRTYTDQVRAIYKRYQETDVDERLGLMLEAMNRCSNFNEQCALYGLWANSVESENEDEWIVAVGKRLMEAGRYSPELFRVWAIWRPLCQTLYFGMSRDSNIPNRLYNRYRGLCYRTVLKYLDLHPDDMLAMNCASVLAGRSNINRFGSYPLGNQAIMEKVQFLPARYEDIDDEEEEEEPEG